MARAARVRLVLLAAAAALLLAAGAAVAAKPGNYAGSTNRHRLRHADIYLQVLRGGLRLRWDAFVYAPCSLPEYGMGVTIGTGSGTYPLLHLRRGHFAISRRYVDKTLVHWFYAFKGHTGSGGFAGTVHVTERWTSGSQHVSCDSHTIAWRARPSNGPFR